MVSVVKKRICSANLHDVLSLLKSMHDLGPRTTYPHFRNHLLFVWTETMANLESHLTHLVQGHLCFFRRLVQNAQQTAVIWPAQVQDIPHFSVQRGALILHRNLRG